MIGIVLVDDHQLVREGIRSILERHADLRVVGEVGDAHSAYRYFDQDGVDLFVVDVTLAGSGGLSLTREITRRRLRQPVLMLSMHEEPDVAAEAFAAGAHGYAVKSESGDELVTAIRKVAAGERYLSAKLSPAAVDALASRGHDGGPLAVLSQRQREVFDLLVRGYSNAAIAAELFISIKTVETHRTHILRKLSVHSLPDLVRFAARHQLLTTATSTPRAQAI